MNRQPGSEVGEKREEGTCIQSEVQAPVEIINIHEALKAQSPSALGQPSSPPPRVVMGLLMVGDVTCL